MRPHRRPYQPHGATTLLLMGVLLVALVAVGLYELNQPAAQGRSTAAATTAGTPSVVSAPATHTPMPVGDIPAWHEVFHDDFNGTHLNTAEWRVYAGQPGGDPGGWWDPAHVTVSNSMLVIDAYSDSADGGRWTSGGISSTFVQTYGKYLVHFRFDPGIGIGHALLLFPANGIWPPEVDFSEDNGSARSSTLATLHYRSNNSMIWGRVNVDLTQWHTLGVEWTPGELRYTLDGRVWFTTSNSGVPNVPMALAIQTQAWPCTGTWGVCPDAQTPRVVRLDVDWVVAYARDR